MQPSIKFTPTAVATDVSELSRALLRKLLDRSHCPACTITSTTRTPARQALAMYNNILKYGEDGQLKLYGPAGDQVIEEYHRQKLAGAGEKKILAAMEATILLIGPSKVSLHCADPKSLNVIDIAPTSIQSTGAFFDALTQAKNDGSVSRFFSPGSHDPAFHVEIPQV